MPIPSNEYRQVLIDRAEAYINLMNDFFNEASALHDKYCTASKKNAELCKSLYMQNFMQDFEKVLDEIIPPSGEKTVLATALNLHRHENKN